jgi:hypothetical protein
MDQITETVTEGFGSRLMSSIVGVLFGLMFFLGSFVLLWWNEGNVIAEKGSLEELKSKVVVVKSGKVLKKNANKPIHTTAKLTTKGKIGDAPLVKAGPYLALERSVEMYQWIETSETKTKKKLGGGKEKTTTYKYHQGWKEGRVDSSSFKKPTGHLNPSLKWKDKSVYAKSTKFGSFNGKEVLKRVSDRQRLDLNPKMLVKPKGAEINDGMLYKRVKGNKTKADQLGDVRISYKVLKPGTYSVIAVQKGKGLGEYTSSNGKSQFLVRTGAANKAAMITQAKDAAGTMALILRIVGFLVMFVGINMIVGPFSTLMDVIPFLGSASRFVIGIAAFIIASVLSSVTILVAMVAHNPIALGVVVVASIAGIVMFVKGRTSKKQQMVSAMPQTNQQQPPKAA